MFTPEEIELIKNISYMLFIILTPIGITFGFLSIFYKPKKKEK